MTTTILRSQKDRSINLIDRTDDGGAMEYRFVQRVDDTIIIYLSSSSGCDKACRFCHLTQTRQTMMTHFTSQDYLYQAQKLFDLIEKEDKLEGVKIVHFNFMARGDALGNPYFVHNTKEIIEGLEAIALDYHLKPKFKISTIFPDGEIFGVHGVNLTRWVHDTLDYHPDLEFYYSLYSLNPKFRKRWIPKTIHPEYIGRVFRETQNRLRLHHALIAGENTSFEDAGLLSDWLIRHDITSHLNIVRYNSFGPSCGTEAPAEIINLYTQFMENTPNVSGVYVVSKVGTDVYASCGTFINKL